MSQNKQRANSQNHSQNNGPSNSQNNSQSNNHNHNNTGISKNYDNSLSTASLNTHVRVGIIGGGVAGTTTAIRLAALGLQVTLLESRSSLIDGPPMCHLHAGGNLYREISDDDAVALLKECIDILRLYPYSIDMRPTVIAVPIRDNGNPDDLLPRLQRLTAVYQQMIVQDPANKVLGEPEDYYRLYNREQLEGLINKEAQPQNANGSIYVLENADTNANAGPMDMDAWVTAAALQLDLDKLQYPLIAVNEYGWNIFRLAASATKALTYYANADIHLDTRVTNVDWVAAEAQWKIDFTTNRSKTADSHQSAIPETTSIVVDYLINASGFRSGAIDDMVGVKPERMVEFKTSYVSHWPEEDTGLAQNLPEIIIHGERGTPHGMVQLTPYANGYYQIHSMSNEATLFPDGRIASTKDSAQPPLNPIYENYIDNGWDKQALAQRTQTAINDVSQFVPRFASANVSGHALFGGQQIPGKDDSLRVADVSLYPEKHYARAENVKASSALVAADNIAAQLVQQKLITISPQQAAARTHHDWGYLSRTKQTDIDDLAIELARLRQFPEGMAQLVTPLVLPTI